MFGGWRASGATRRSEKSSETEKIFRKIPKMKYFFNFVGVSCKVKKA